MTGDPIADMLSRIKNAVTRNHETVEVPKSRTKERIAQILKAQGYITDYSVIDDRRQGLLMLYLKYSAPKRNAIAGVKRQSKPGRRVYVAKDEIPRVRRGLGLAVLSTTKGLLSGDDAKKAGLGGELLFTMW